MARMLSVRAVLFDLDGTFADTAPDLAYALNQTLLAFGESPLPYDRIRPVASHGGNGLIRLGFSIAPETPGFAEKRAYLLEVYQANLCVQTRLFDGVARLIDQLEACGLPWGIVTNKPSWLTDPLLADLGYARRAAVVVSGDTCTRRKPHPEPILHACRILGVPAAQTLYVGDARRDIDAGRAAGSLTAAVRFGYIEAGEDPANWNADLLVDDGAELISILGVARPPVT